MLISFKEINFYEKGISCEITAETMMEWQAWQSG